jgi:hypothetical protein
VEKLGHAHKLLKKGAFRIANILKTAVNELHELILIGD